MIQSLLNRQYPPSTVINQTEMSVPTATMTPTLESVLSIALMLVCFFLGVFDFALDQCIAVPGGGFAYSIKFV